MAPSAVLFRSNLTHKHWEVLHDQRRGVYHPAALQLLRDPKYCKKIISTLPLVDVLRNLERGQPSADGKTSSTS